ncbi:MAG TPA: DNA-directed RNA polymerase subunit beta [bacterium]|nr:DNA-directed RNA polymerase subunit beta [bacterium]HNL25967.1 DNA-directed RNA polymerase subunit beta [bacterium]
MSTKKVIERVNFAKNPSVVPMPDLLEIQIDSYKEFLQEDVPAEKRTNTGLQNVFLSNFPVDDAKELFKLEFLKYYVERPKYDVRECQERGVSFSVPLKATLRLISKKSADDKHPEIIEQDVYLGNLPYITEKGTFVINGAERVIVSQLHRSPGVFFDESLHPNGTKMFSARVIPFRGSWIEFTTDINDVMYVFIDRKKKFPVTTFLRALGYSSDRDMLKLFNIIDEVEISKIDGDKIMGRKLALDIVNEETGEIIAERETELTEETFAKLKRSKIKKIDLIKAEEVIPEVIANTIRKDVTKDEKEALETIYRQLRSGDAPDLETARGLLERQFFNSKRYDLGDVGRNRINKRLSLNIPESVTVLTKDDIIAIIKALIELRDGIRQTDDIDHLGNRRVKTVGEQLAGQFSVALTRMTRTIKERMNLRDNENLTPQDLVNARTVSSVINTFFGTSQLSQFMDQTNPLSELTHKRRLSALGPGGLTRERAGFEVRDVHYTHYGRLCPVETPEGPNIGLISSLCLFARVNRYGFIETPYRKVVKGRVQENIEFLIASDEDGMTIAQANEPIDKKGSFDNEFVKARKEGDFPVVTPDEIQFMDISPAQIVSPAAALIPFLEHDDANRALMGSNMQRQAVPLLVPEAPIVGTGLERTVAVDSRSVIISDIDGVIEDVSATEITIRKKTMGGKKGKDSVSDTMTYRLLKFFRTNQDTCINQRPIVSVGDEVKAGQIIADGCSTERGDLALGRNVLAAFMPWRGYNFEDAIILSERVIRDDVFTSIHIEEYEIQVRDTKRGEEELTREIPNVSEEATKDLDENGVIRVGAEVLAGDILVGKVTPKGETDPTPEEKLLKAIFGDKAGDVKDASLKAPPGMKGIVISTKLFSRKKKDTESKKEDKKKLEELENELKKQVRRLKSNLRDELTKLLVGKVSAGVVYTDGSEFLKKGKKFTEDSFKNLDPAEINLQESRWTDDEETNEMANFLFDNFERNAEEVETEYNSEKFKVQVGDELPPGIVQLAKVQVAKKRKISVGDKMAGRHGNKGVVSKIVPTEDMPFLSDGTPVDVILNPLGVPSRMNLGQIFETSLGWAGKILGKHYETNVFDGAKISDVKNELRLAGLPDHGKVRLTDGRTGDRFDQETMVGYIYMMKLNHLVDDKIHSRSIGPYSLITQQPLGGKAQFGGQRFGEMEVWALEAYGAAYILQEILTYKSDDVGGRAKVYEAIVKGDNLPEPGVPESFNVLVRELQGLGLEVKIE